MTVLRRGIRVTGRVLDDAGKPILGASVLLGRMFQASSVKARTDDAGRFTLENAEPGERPLTVQAAGHSPEMKTILVQPGVSPAEFRLARGHAVRGRVVDRTGKPIPGAYVAVDRWRGQQVLEWRSETDAEGRFLWDGAPGDRVLIGIGKDGYKSADEVSVGPSDNEVVFTLDRGGALQDQGDGGGLGDEPSHTELQRRAGRHGGLRDLEPLVHQDVS